MAQDSSVNTISPFKKVFDFLGGIAESDRYSGFLMIGCALLGLICANIPVISGGIAHAQHFVFAIPFLGIHLDIEEWIQDGLLTIFFLAVGLELKVEFRKGELSNPKTAAVPILAAVGGMAVPPLIFFLVLQLATLFGLSPQGFHLFSSGWPVPTATDIAFSLAILSLFSKGLPKEIRPFLMTLATVDDLIAILLIAFLFTSFNEWYWFALVVVGSLAWYFVSHSKRSWVRWYILIPIGLFLWVVTLHSGLHPTLAGVLIGILSPTRIINKERLPRAQKWHHQVNFFSALLALPVFAFFSTALDLRHIPLHTIFSPLLVAIVLALVLGKPLGVMALSWMSVHWARLRLPGQLRVRDLWGMACACGIGFTVSFLIASLAFVGSELSEDAHLAVLIGSVASAVLAGVIMKFQYHLRHASRSGRTRRRQRRARLDKLVSKQAASAGTSSSAGAGAGSASSVATTTVSSARARSSSPAESKLKGSRKKKFSVGVTKIPALKAFARLKDGEASDEKENKKLKATKNKKAIKISKTNKKTKTKNIDKLAKASKDKAEKDKAEKE